MSYKTDCKNTRNGKNKIMNQIEPIDESMFYVKFCKINYLNNDNFRYRNCCRKTVEKMYLCAEVLDEIKIIKR